MGQGVYKIQNLVNNKIYIGCSKDIDKRWQMHKYCYSQINIPQCEKKILYKAFRKYGLDNFSFSIVEETQDYYEREKYWIQYYNSLIPNGYNMTSGGEGHPNCNVKGEKNPNAKLTEKEVLFIRQCALNDLSQQDIYNDFFIEQISFSHFQRIWTGRENYWNNICPEILEHIHSEEYIYNIKTKAALSRNIVKENLQRKEILKKLLDKNYSRMEAFNYYIENYESDYSLSAFTHLWYDLKPKMEKSKIHKIDLNTGKILESYDSFAEAARKNNCDSSGISKVCKGQRFSCGGYKWVQN